MLEIESKLETYYSKNKARILERLRIARLENPEKYRERGSAAWKKWALAHPEEYAARQQENGRKRTAIKAAERQAFEAANPIRRDGESQRMAEARIARYGKDLNRVERYRAINSSKIVAKVREWRKLNPEAVARHANNRRARKLAVVGTLSKGLRDKLFGLQVGKCACCGRALGHNFHLDHIVPLSRGGNNEDSNIQLLRSKCNAQKSDKDPITFMQQRGYLL